MEKKTRPFAWVNTFSNTAHGREIMSAEQRHRRLGHSTAEKQHTTNEKNALQANITVWHICCLSKDNVFLPIATTMEFHLKCNVVISRILESIAPHLTNQRISQCPCLVSEGFWMVNDRDTMQTRRDGSKKTILCIHIENMSTALGIWSSLCSSISSSSLFSASCCHLFWALSARSTAASVAILWEMRSWSASVLVQIQWFKKNDFLFTPRICMRIMEQSIRADWEEE